MCMALMGRLYLIPGGYQGVRELPGQDLEENDSIGIDIRLEAVRVVILHPDDLRSLWTYRQNKRVAFSVSFHCLERTRLIDGSEIKAALLTIQRMDPEGCST